LGEGARFHAIIVGGFEEIVFGDLRGPFGSAFHWEDGRFKVFATLAFWSYEKAGRVFLSEPARGKIAVGGYAEAEVVGKEAVTVFSGSLDWVHGLVLSSGFIFYPCSD